MYRDAESRIDFVGAGVLAGALFLILYGVSQMETWHVRDIRTVSTIGGGVLVLAVWWAWERRTTEPFIDTRLLASRPVASMKYRSGSVRHAPASQPTKATRL